MCIDFVQAFEDQEKIQLKSRVEHETPTTFQGKGYYSILLVYVFFLI